MKYHQSSAGVTLIELLVVVAIMSIIATIVIPRFASHLSSGKTVEVAAKSIVSDLRLSRQLAISTHTKHYLYIDTTAHNYALYITAVSEANRVSEQHTLDSGISITGDVTFGFEPNSSVEVGSGTSVALSDGTTTWTISITPATGRVVREKTGG